MSAKKTMILNHYHMLNLENEAFKDNELILATPLGLICGKPINFAKEEDTNKNDFAFAALLKELSSDFLDDLKKDNRELDPNDGYILLYDVTIRNGTDTSKIPLLTVFYDQIIGVTLGNYD